LNIYPGLCSVKGKNQNITKNIVAGMTLKLLPTHLAGFVMSGKPLYLAMPRLPTQPPYVTANETDPDSGAFIRLTYGTIFGQAQTGFIYDAIYDGTAVDEQLMRVCFPLN
jgi:hypothetical protein